MRRIYYNFKELPGDTDRVKNAKAQGRTSLKEKFYLPGKAKNDERRERARLRRQQRRGQRYADATDDASREEVQRRFRKAEDRAFGRKVKIAEEKRRLTKRRGAIGGGGAAAIGTLAAGKYAYDKFVKKKNKENY